MNNLFQGQQIIPPQYWLDGTSEQPQLEKRGVELLKENKVATIMLAGGESSRIGIDGLRGNIPIGPVTIRSIFKLQGDKIAALRERYSPNMQFFVMTSYEVDVETRNSFERENYFNIPPESITFFKQPSYPVLDSIGDHIILSNGSKLSSPGGNGGFLDALRDNNIIDKLQRNGIEYIFYFQYPNVLENVCDPIMVGFHDLRQADVTIKAVTEYTEEEPMGRVVEVNGKIIIIEYQIYRQLRYNLGPESFPACFGTYIFSVSFLERCIKNNLSLPFYTIPYVNKKYNDLPITKVEQFACDLLQYSSKNELMIVMRGDERAPVKTQCGKYSIDSAKKALTNLYYKWMINAGGIPSHEEPITALEISPRFALNCKELRAKLSPGFTINNNMVLLE
jgi:UDP-N-acetylglucosamine/UDP-N-acetylgalactosamine diphosphorylase